MKNSKIFNLIVGILVGIALVLGSLGVNQWIGKERMLRRIIDRLTAETRVAEVLVTKSEFDEATKKIKTTIKFLEYDAKGKPLEPKYFTFEGNLIQFQSLVIRFADKFVAAGDRLRGKSAYLFMKAFVLDGAKTQECVINKAGEVPGGYRVEGNREQDEFQQKLWTDFWNYALDPQKRERAGIKHAQIEAPGSMFLPGTIYTLRIEHAGGIVIDAKPIPEILKGEKVESPKI
ncbi:MAG TPA: hypothetical protein PLL75_01660 [Candidatus Omnitrophota bacterium]|nr:hypothetical protein [Candidatus Omnitrophota bacterium]HPS36420.1 hypothetical protein [Candidatus Omnitrophota bacterium]